MAIDTKLIQATNAYANVANLKGGVATPQLPGEAADAVDPSFTQLLSEALDEARKTGYTGEKTSNEAVAGKAELHKLVVAVTNAELTLQTVVAVRDRMINAYNDIVRMPI